MEKIFDAAFRFTLIYELNSNTPEFRAALRDNAIAMGGSGRETEAGKIWEGGELAALIGPGVEFESYLRKNPETLGFDRPLIRAVHCFQALLNHVDR